MNNLETLTCSCNPNCFSLFPDFPKLSFLVFFLPQFEVWLLVHGSKFHAWQRINVSDKHFTDNFTQFCMSPPLFRWLVSNYNEYNDQHHHQWWQCLGGMSSQGFIMAGQIVEPVEEIIHRSHGDLGSWLPSPGLPVPAPWTCYVANPKIYQPGPQN